MNGTHLSVIVPMLNEEAAIAPTLRAIRTGAPDGELIVVDGGSNDRGVEIARPLSDVLITSARGRAVQMNAGAARAAGDVLAFVHADTIVPATLARDIDEALADSRTVGGRFDVRLADPHPLLRLTGFLINLRSRLSRTATGDQAIFVRRDVFRKLGGFSLIPICEDLEFARRIKRAGRVACLRSQVVTSARRWRERGMIKTILTMWTIRALYLMGVAPARLARIYADVR